MSQVIKEPTHILDNSKSCISSVKCSYLAHIMLKYVIIPKFI